ncbi:PREDICTED: Holliday junction recognition protein [Ceratotherium simum simum]|uniref:Holliday junction recognition protein n=1 Tax=Ceratotherium simum simum TaxID=73337 RepID=A0ABM1CN67_CERSS|nr:PREDICTED: Holliday junction recognition protein [Ceratotherium simum simum]
MEGDVLGEEALLRKLRDSRRRFQKRMQRLIEKYNQPFEDAPLVQMSTLTYDTPEGLRIWGGRLVKERNKEQIQVLTIKFYCQHSLPRGNTDVNKGVDLAIVPRNAGVSVQGTSGTSLSSSQSFEADDICDMTISDMYAGMLHSMSRLLSAKPSCIISTKTFILQNWNSRRRHRCKSRMNRTYCRAVQFVRLS